ncbi:helix-turn-helix domain-containing protein [Marinactinospora rubrisoli]|uniref:Helix-turn-helix domain-containing protein n=1 Tax=Marinactinospora rubrisoli TaxID=2715399 RepID=A0ABW2KCA0_9ACTN
MVDKVDALWVRWGAELMRLRSLSGRTQTDVGKSALLSKSTVSSFERGTRLPKRHHAEALDTALSTGGSLTRLWQELKQQREVPEWFRDSLLMERKATEIKEYHSILVPGLLQTAEYARVLISARQVGASKEHIDHTVKVRTERLPTLLVNRPTLWFVVDEIVLTRVVGDEQVMRGQLEHIVSLADNGTIRFQVIPGDVRRHCGLCAPFREMVTSAGQAVVRMEHTFGGTNFGEPDKVRQMQGLFGALQAEALSPIRSIDLVRKIMGNLL